MSPKSEKTFRSLHGNKKQYARSNLQGFHILP